MTCHVYILDHGRGERQEVQVKLFLKQLAFITCAEHFMGRNRHIPIIPVLFESSIYSAENSILMEGSMLLQGSGAGLGRTLLEGL